MEAAGPGGLLLGASGSQLLLDGVPLESTPAERSFANLLNASGVASICFHPQRSPAKNSANLVAHSWKRGRRLGRFQTASSAISAMAAIPAYA